MREHQCIQVYEALLRLYPRSFRDDFANEMMEVFSQAVSEAASVSKRRSLALIFQEMLELPRLAFHERMNERCRETGAIVHSRSWEGALAGKELIVALAAFAIPVFWIAFSTAPLSPLFLLPPLVLVFIGFVLVSGILKGFPRWCLLYLGLSLSMVSFSVVVDRITARLNPASIPWIATGAWDHNTQILWQAIVAGMMWLTLFMVVLVLLGIVAVIRCSRQFYLRIRQDWTLVSFVLYCGSLSAVALLYKDYLHEEVYALASLLCLAAGAWFYLRSPHSWQRILALVTGATLSMWISAAGQWLIIPRQNWLALVQWQSSEYVRLIEAGFTLMAWGWLIIFLLLPRVLRFLPLPKELAWQGSPDTAA